MHRSFSNRSEHREGLRSCEGNKPSSLKVTLQIALYIQKGGVKFTVVSESGKEAVIAIFGLGDFFGEGGQTLRMGTATAIVPTTVLVIEKDEMIGVLHAEHELSDRFITHMLARNIRVEADLVDQLFNSTEKRLARTLLLLARYGKEGQPERVLQKVSQETLAEMIGTSCTKARWAVPTPIPTFNAGDSPRHACV
jgi:CRP/FNR family transcriptional regulator, cyclic AMP receptor protein